jgi:hypothetical protein
MIQTGARTDEIIGRAKLHFILGGLLLILVGFGIHALSVDESPSLTWLIIIGGIWSILASLGPDSWIHSIGSKLNPQNLKRGFRFIGLTVLGLVAVWLLIAGAAVAIQLIEKKASQATNNGGGTEKGQLIDENAAFQVLQSYATLDEARKVKAAQILRDYRDQQERLNLPLWPSRIDELNNSRERVRSVFDNPLSLDAEDGTFSAADAVQPGKGDKMRKREANILFLADQYQADEAHVRQRYDFYKAEASAKWGIGTLDDEQFFFRAKAELEGEQLRPSKK